jgi:hypothetical protein
LRPRAHRCYAAPLRWTVIWRTPNEYSIRRHGSDAPGDVLAVCYAASSPAIVGRWRAIVKWRFFDWVLLGCGLIQMTSTLALGYALLSSLA